LTEREVLGLYLADRPDPCENGQVAGSSFRAALGDARGSTGRNVTTGALEDVTQAGSRLGLIAYLCFLDQVGAAIYRPSRGRWRGDTRWVVAAFHSFMPTVRTAEREAIYALRCALAQDYSFMNWHPVASMRHRFVLDPRMGPLARLPRRQWTGLDYGASLVKADPTFVSMPAVAECAEQIRANVYFAYHEDDLAIALDGGAAELRTRYFLNYASPPA
jgi:hypothetical protein